MGLFEPKENVLLLCLIFLLQISNVISQCNGNGLLGTYYGGENFSVVLTTRLEAPDYNWGNIGPGAPVPIAKGEDINAKVEQHISAGCPQTTVQHTNTCSYPRCRKYEVVPVICKQCYKNFCFSHRFPQDHACEGVTGGVASKAREQHKKTSTSASSSASKAAHSHNPTALKVRLMKMKMQAKGDSKIPADKRFYLEVVFPLNSGVAPKLMYFDPRWSIGKVLDLVAEAGNIVNKNNVIQDKNSKLHLIALKTGEPLPNEKYLDTLSTDVLQSGDAVMLDTLQALSP